jgi:hypothetical protein
MCLSEMSANLLNQVFPRDVLKSIRFRIFVEQLNFAVEPVFNVRECLARPGKSLTYLSIASSDPGTKSLHHGICFSWVNEALHLGFTTTPS